MKAYVVKENFKNNTVGEIFQVMPDEKWTGWWSAYVEVCDISEDLKDLDKSYLKAVYVEATETESAYYEIQKADSTDQRLRDDKMNSVRSERNKRLASADVEINKLEDAASDSSAYRTYRQSLRDVTETYKKVDGDWKASVDSLEVSTFSYPTKPS